MENKMSKGIEFDMSEEVEILNEEETETPSTYVELIDCGVKMYTNGTIEDAVAAIYEEYQRHDVELYNILTNINLVGYNMVDTVTIYAKLYKMIDGDIVARFNFEDNFVARLDEE